MKPVRIALIGAGGIVCHAHKPAFLQFPHELQPVAVADSHRPAADELANAFGVPSFPDYVEMLDRMPGEIDAVLITTPHFLHAQAAAEALGRGIPALVEKPLSCTVEELRHLEALEKTSGAFVQAGQQQRFGAEENALKLWLKSPEFGEPRLFNLDIYQNIEGYVTGKPDPWILDKKRAGGGIVISVAIHLLDLLRFWFEDDFVEVYAKGTFEAPLANGAESSVAATLTMRNGMIGTLNCSYVAKRCPYSQRTLLFGTHGSLYQHLDKPGGGYAGAYYTSTDGGFPTPEWSMMYQGWKPVSGKMDAVPETSPFVTQMREFAKNVRSKSAGENSLGRNFNTIAVVEALGKSLSSGKPEPVATR
jgi:UDP-N-acetylglucosamine 3-dehydrogenase